MSFSISTKQVVTVRQDGSELSTPWWEIASRRDGPTLLVIAAQHGNEVQGTEVIRRFAPICAEGLVAGTVMLVPMANLLAIRHRRNSAKIGPEEKQTELHNENNLNRHWPGDLQGNDVARISHGLDESVVTRASHVVDLHCWSRLTASATLGCDVGESRLLAQATGMRFISWSDMPEEITLPTQLRKYSILRGKAAVTIEFAGQFCVDERQVIGGVRALANIARLLDMLEGEPEIPPNSGIAVTDDNTTVVETPRSGLFVEAPGLRLEDRVEAGQSLGHLLLDDDLSTIELTSPVGGWLHGYGSHRPKRDVSLADQHPYCEAGESIATIVSAQEDM